MAKTVVLQGQTFTIPEPGDVGWGSLSELIERLTINVSELLQGPAATFPPLQRKVREFTGDSGVILPEDDVILVNNSAEEVSLTLPLDSQISEGKVITVKDSSGTASTNIITVFAFGGVEIDGLSFVRIDDDYGDLTVIFDGVNWHRIQSLEEDFEKGLLPLGSIIPFTSHLTGSFVPPATGEVKRGLMLCDGSTIPAGQRLSGTLPDLTDNRFLMGAVSSGTSGNATSLAHTHEFDHTHGTDSALTILNFSHSHGGSTQDQSANFTSSVSTTGGAASFNKNVLNTDQNNHRHEYGVQSVNRFAAIGELANERILALADHDGSGFSAWVTGSSTGAVSRQVNGGVAASKSAQTCIEVDALADTNNSTATWTSSTVTTTFTNPTIAALDLNDAQTPHVHSVNPETLEQDLAHTHSTNSQSVSTTSSALAATDVRPKYFEVIYLMRVR